MKDGIFYRRQAGDYLIFRRGQYIGFAITRWGAEAMYKTADNDCDDIPFDGSYTSDDSVTGPQDCGLVSGVDY